MVLQGLATPEGTNRFIERFPKLSEKCAYRRFRGKSVSSIGLGTYLGDPTDADDKLYGESIKLALSNGCNVLDTASNYRHMRSERIIGQVLGELCQAGKLERDEVLLCTKGGFLPYDCAVGLSPADYLERTFFSRGLVDREIGKKVMHSLNPAFIESQLELSLENLKVKSIDVFYLHNPETQLAVVPRDDFTKQLEEVFRFLEAAVKKGTLGCYGLATWDGFRVPSTNRNYLSLADILAIAVKVGGDQHGFGAIQLPLNLSNAEALSVCSQTFGAKKEQQSILYAATRAKVAVFTSASIAQGHLAKFLPREVLESFPGLPEDVHRAIQFARSSPGVLSALVGMRHPAHVVTNLQLLNFLPAPAENFVRLFQ